MRLKGIAEVTIISACGELKQQIIQENLIPDASWLGILGNNAVRGYFNRRISIALDETEPVASVSVVTGVIGTCATPSGVASPIYIENVDPPYGTITGQISPVGVERTFYSVALTNLSPANVQSVASTTAYARLKLDIPCVQGINDFVNITYSIQFLDNVGDGLIDKALNRYDLGRCLFNLGDYRIGNIYYNFSDPYLQSIALPPVGVGSTTTGAINTPNFKWNYTKTLAEADLLGVIVNAIPQGLSNNGLRVYALGFNEYDKEPFQTAFKHGSSSTLPFFDSLNIPSSQGSVFLEGTWTGKFPEFYTIDFTAAGATGGATYRFSTFKYVGFVGNTYTLRDIDLLYLRPEIQYATGLHGWREEDFDKHRLSDTEVVQYDTTGVSIVDVVDGTPTNFDADTTPALPCTNIRQVAVDATNRLIYVGCRDTGLWIVNLGTNTITNPLTNPCYGVDVGRNNIAVAIASSGLYRSTNWATPQTFTYTDITSSWARVQLLKADPEHPNDRIAIVANNPTNTANRVVWHQFSDDVTTTGYENALVPSFPASLDVSDINSQWWLFLPNDDLFQLTFATATLGTNRKYYNHEIDHSVYGLARYAKVSFYQDSIFNGYNTAAGASFVPGVRLSGATININLGAFNNGFTLPNCIVPLDSGLTVFSGINVQSSARTHVAFIKQILASDNSLLISEYGWDGSNWVIGNANSKTTHADTQALINGLTIRFADGASPPQFVQDEFVTQGINYGQLKDNATRLTWKSAWYSKVIHNEIIASATIAATLVLPAASEPLFRKLDDDATAVPHRFFIDGVLATKVWTDGTAPAATEVSLNPNGTLTFNAADVGKALTGSYVWLEF